MSLYYITISLSLSLCNRGTPRRPRSDIGGSQQRLREINVAGVPPSDPTVKIFRHLY